jgi:hypothetical protein
MEKEVMAARTLDLALGVDDDARVVLKVHHEAVLSAERLALPHHDQRHRCTQAQKGQHVGVMSHGCAECAGRRTTIGEVAARRRKVGQPSTSKVSEFCACSAACRSVSISATAYTNSNIHLSLDICIHV